MSDLYSRACAEIDLGAVRNNMKVMLDGISSDTRIAAVVKKDGYGCGAVQVAGAVDDMERVWGYCTATFEEAQELRDAGFTKPILILGYVFPYCYVRLAGTDIYPTVFREDMLDQLEEAASAVGKKIRFFIAVDTGMTRIGIRPDETGLAFVRRALTFSHIEMVGIFTHFSRADESDHTTVLRQQQKYASFVTELRNMPGADSLIVSMNNSAGIISFRESDYDLCRAGITLYGMWPSSEVPKDRTDLRPVLALYSSIVYVKDVEPGTEISYGGTYITQTKRRIATVSIGYGDGYPRSLSGKGAYVLVRGRKAPITGRICMDQFMIDVTEIPDVSEGDRVTLIGRDGNEEITIEELGDLSGRFNYELACDIDKRVPRRYING